VLQGDQACSADNERRTFRQQIGRVSQLSRLSKNIETKHTDRSKRAGLFGKEAQPGRQKQIPGQKNSGVEQSRSKWSLCRFAINKNHTHQTRLTVEKPPTKSRQLVCQKQGATGTQSFSLLFACSWSRLSPKRKRHQVRGRRSRMLLFVHRGSFTSVYPPSPTLRKGSRVWLLLKVIVSFGAGERDDSPSGWPGVSLMSRTKPKVSIELIQEHGRSLADKMYKSCSHHTRWSSFSRHASLSGRFCT
jgi:hypothetical protein